MLQRGMKNSNSIREMCKQYCSYKDRAGCGDFPVLSRTKGKYQHKCVYSTCYIILCTLCTHSMTAQAPCIISTATRSLFALVAWSCVWDHSLYCGRSSGLKDLDYFSNSSHLKKIGSNMSRFHHSSFMPEGTYIKKYIAQWCWKVMVSSL